MHLYSCRTDSRPRAVTDGDDHSQPPLLLGEPSTSGLRLHTPPTPPTDSGTAKKKLPPLKPVEIRVTPCLVKQPPSQQPLFESSTSHQSDLGSEATVTYESDPAQPGVYKLRDRKNRQFLPSSSNSDSDDVYEDSVVKHPTKIRKSPRQMAARRRRVNEIVYKDLSSSEIESTEDTESMGTVGGGTEDTTDLSDSTKLPKADGARRPNGMSAGGTPTKIMRSARLRRDVESGSSRRISPRKRNSSSEPEGSRKLRATERELRRSDGKRDLNKTEFQKWSSHKRDSSWESDNSRKSQTTLRRSERKRDWDKAGFLVTSPHSRDSSQESDNSRTTIRRSERMRHCDKAEFQIRSPRKRGSSQESEKSGSSIGVAVELRRSQRKRGLDRAEPCKRDSSQESENSRNSIAAAVKLRRSERNHGLDEDERDSSSESESTAKFKATALKLRRSERKQCSDQETNLHHKRDSSSESDSTRKPITTTSGPRRSERRRNLDKADLQTHSSRRQDNSNATVMTLRSSTLRQDSDKVGVQAPSHERDSSSESESLTEEESMLRRTKRTNHANVGLKIKSPKKKSNSASHAGSDSKPALGSHHILRQRRKDNPAILGSHCLKNQLHPSNPMISELNSKHQSLLTSGSDTACEIMEEECHNGECGRSEKGQFTTNEARRVNHLQDVVNFFATESAQSDTGDSAGTTLHATTKAKKSETKHSKNTTSDRERKGTKSKGSGSQARTLQTKRDTPSATATRSAIDNDKGVPLKTASPDTNASAVQGDEAGASNNATTSNFYGHRLRGHPGNSPSTSPQSSAAKSSVSPVNLRGGKIREALTQLGDSTSKQDQRKKVTQHHKTTPTKMPVDEQIQEGERRKDGDTGPTKSTNQWISPRRLEQDRRQGDIQRIKSIIETLDKNSPMRRSPRMHASSTAEDLRVQQGQNSPPLAEKKSQQLAITEDSNPSSRHERSTFATVTDSAASTKVVPSKSTPQKSPVNSRRKSSAKSLSPSDSRAGLPSSLPRDFKRPKKRLNFSQNSSGADSDGSVKNTVKRVRFATTCSSDSEELSETDAMLLNTASESHQERESPKKNPAVDCAAVETSSVETSLHVASEITVSSDASGSSQSPSLLSESPITKRKRRRTRKGVGVPQTPPTQLSLRGDEGIRLPTPPLATSTTTVLHRDDSSDLDKTQRGGSSGIRTVLSQVSQLKHKRRSKQSNGQQRKPRNKVQSRTAKTPSLSEQCNGAMSIGQSATAEKSPQQNKDGTTRGSSRGATGSENTRKRNRSKKMESSYEDESATITVAPKKRRKISDTYVPPSSYYHRHDKDSTTSSRSPRKKRRKGHHSSSGGKGTEGSDQEENPAHCEVQGEEHSTTSTSVDATNTGRSNREEAPANDGNQREVLVPAPVSGDGTSAGRSDREEAPANNVNQREVPVPALASGDGNREEAPANNGNQMEMIAPASASEDTNREKAPANNRNQRKVIAPALASGNSTKSNREEAPSNNGNQREAIAPASVSGDGTKTNREEAPTNNGKQRVVIAPASASGDAVSTSITIDSDSQDSLLREGILCSVVGDRGTGSNDRAQPSVGYGGVVVQVLSALHNPGAPSMFTTGYSGGRDSVLHVGMGNPLIATPTRRKTPVSGPFTHSIPTYDKANKSTTSIERSNSVVEQAPADEMTIQSPEIDIVGYTPEYSEPTEGESTDDGVIMMDSQDQSHAQLESAPNPSYMSNSGHQSAYPSMSYQSTLSNADRLVYTHPPYTSNSGRPFTNVNQSTSRICKRVSTYTPHASMSGQPSTMVIQSTSFGNDRLVSAYTPSNGRPRACVNQATPSTMDRCIYTHTPYKYSVGRPRSNLSTWYHENSPGNSPEIGLMNHLPFRTETPRQQHQQLSFRNTNNNIIKGAYSQDESDGHERLNLIDDEYEMSQVQSQYYHAPVQIVARKMDNFTDSESIVSDSSASVLSVPR